MAIVCNALYLLMKKGKEEKDELTIETKDGDNWIVRNIAKGTAYTVTRRRDWIYTKESFRGCTVYGTARIEIWVCECPDFQYRKRHCKHIKAVIEQEEEEQIKHERIAVERTEDLMILD